MNTPNAARENRAPEDSGEGLTSREAEKRLEEYGYNELVQTHTSPVLQFLSHFWGPIPWMIEIAAVLSALVHRWPDLGIILTLLVVNGIVGFWEEFQATNAMSALKSRLALEARVRHDDKWQAVPARELVPGDVVRLRLGDVVPADARLLTGDPIQVDQSALTGESLPVTHESGDAVYSGSVVKLGGIDALVYATGVNTLFGKTAHLVEETRTTSHFQRAVLQIDNYLIVLALLLVIVIIGVALFRRDPLVTTLQFALVLTVAAIPVAMPTVLSVTMAVGARLLAAKEAIVTRLASIEELAGIDVLCSDKTGTLTQNKLVLGQPVSTGTTTPEQVILCAALASRVEDEDAIDEALLAGVGNAQALAAYQVDHFTPFDPVRKRTEAVVTGEGRRFRTSKGAPQVIMALAENADFGRGWSHSFFRSVLHRRTGFPPGPDVYPVTYLSQAVGRRAPHHLCNKERGHFWSVRPSSVLLGAVLVTQLVATLITVYGLFMTPTGWGWALFTWAYALVWFVVNDEVKVATLRLLKL